MVNSLCCHWKPLPVSWPCHRVLRDLIWVPLLSLTPPVSLETISALGQEPFPATRLCFDAGLGTWAGAAVIILRADETREEQQGVGSRWLCSLAGPGDAADDICTEPS